MIDNVQKYNFTQERSDYLTPPILIEEIFQELNLLGIMPAEIFDVDVCCSQKNVPAKKYFIDGEIDGLTAEWGNFNYCNPPFSHCGQWVRKAYEEFENGKTTVLLIPARTETKYFQTFLLTNGYDTKRHIYIKFLRKGYSFLNPDTKESMGVFKNALAIVILDGRSKAREKAVA